MKPRIRRLPALLCVGTLVILVAWGTGTAPRCDGAPPPTRPTSAPTTRPAADPVAAERAVGQVRADWERRTAGLDLRLKTSWEERNKVLESLLKEAGPDAFDGLIARFRAGYDDSSAFDRHAMDCLISVLVKKGDRDRLVQLFAARCPDAAFFNTVEFFVVYVGTKDQTLRDPLLIFCEALDAAGDEANRRQIARVLTRAFPGENWGGDGAAALVRRVRAWYAANKDRVEPNADYHRYSNQVGEEPPGGPLFVPRKRGTTDVNESKPHVP